MPAPPVNLGSGFDSQRTIQQLLQLERIPITRLQQDNERANQVIRAWDEVRNRSKLLSDKSRYLYSFTGPFAKKNIESSDPGAITGEASPNVQAADQEIQVLKLASSHQIHSDTIANDAELAAARFSIKIGDKTESFQFPGGKLPALLRLLRTKASGLFEATSVRVDESTSMLAMRSLLSGKRGEIQFTDEDGLLEKIGLIKKGEGQGQIKDLTLAQEMLRDFNRSSVENGQSSLDGGKLLLNGKKSTLINLALKAEDSIAFHFEQGAPSSQGNGARNVNAGPDIQANVGDVRLHGYNIDRELQVNGAASPANGSGSGFGLVWTENGQEKRREVLFTELAGDTRGKIGDWTEHHPITGIYFFADESRTLRISSLKTTEMTAGANLTAAHVTSEAADAEFLIDGVRAARPTNSGITDIIEGASLNFHRPTASAVRLTVKVDAAGITAKIKDWVEAYNNLLKFCRDNSQTANREDFERNRPTDDRAGIDEGMRLLQAQAGVFATDSTVRQLLTTIRSIVSSSYPSNAEKPYRVLSDIGITTGAVGADWREIQFGYLNLDEGKLQDALGRSPEGVRELFSTDTNEDNVPDTGVALQMTRILEPYTRGTGGLIAARIDLLKSQITDNKERIRNKELSIQAMEQNLRRRFGRMESSVQQSRATGDYLRNQIRNPE